MVRRLKRLFSRRPAHRSIRRHPEFIAAWMRSPLAIGALVPSSKGLARAMASQIDLDQPGMVIELGAGCWKQGFHQSGCW
jgi:phospholipid N-methyltransferase